MLEIPMRLGIILVGDMKQEAIRQFLRWDGREMGSRKKKGNVSYHKKCWSLPCLTSPYIIHLFLWKCKQSVLVFALFHSITMAHLSSSLCWLCRFSRSSLFFKRVAKAKAKTLQFYLLLLHWQDLILYVIFSSGVQRRLNMQVRMWSFFHGLLGKPKWFDPFSIICSLGSHCMGGNYSGKPI
jgi:hypothetical protein